MNNMNIKTKNQITLGIIAILISGFSFSLMSLFVKLSGDLPTIQKVFFRNFIIGVISIIPILKHIKNISYPNCNKQWFVIFLRSLLGLLGIFCNFYAVNKIHLADLSVIQRLSPFVILILSYFIFKEKMTKLEISTIFVAFLGILLVIKPNFNNFMSYGFLIALLGAFFAGGAYTTLRYLGLAGVSSKFIVFFFSVFTTLILFPFVVINYKAMTLYQTIMIICIGISGALGQFGITYAYKLAAAKTLSVFDYSQIIFSGLFGFIFFSEKPDIYSVLGYILIISMGIFLSYKK